jgi:hypothetical protein
VSRPAPAAQAVGGWRAATRRRRGGGDRRAQARVQRGGAGWTWRAVGGGSFATSPDGLAEALALLDSFGFAIGGVGSKARPGLAGRSPKPGRGRLRRARGAGNRTAERRRRRRWHKTDREDAEAIARETLADPGLPPAGKQRRPDPDWDELVAVRNRRKSLINQRVRLLNEAEAVLTGLPLTVRAVLPATSRVRLACGRCDQAWPARSRSPPPTGSTSPGWSRPPVTSPAWRAGRRARQADPGPAGPAGRYLTQEYGIAAVGAMDLLVESATRAASPPRRSSPAGAGWRRWRFPRAGATRRPPSPARPGRQPAGELHPVPDARHPGPRRPARPLLHRQATRRAQDQAGARRAHKRHLANVVIRRMWADHTRRHTAGAQPIAAAA